MQHSLKRDFKLTKVGCLQLTGANVRMAPTMEWDTGETTPLMAIILLSSTMAAIIFGVFCCSKKGQAKDKCQKAKEGQKAAANLPKDGGKATDKKLAKAEAAAVGGPTKSADQSSKGEGTSASLSSNLSSSSKRTKKRTKSSKKQERRQSLESEKKNDKVEGKQ
uniref:Uncharacterized protein n=1 Tax=Trichuris muris TaxID=70415 RepID=A0A5S6QDZ5_TRIMR